MISGMILLQSMVLHEKNPREKIINMLQCFHAVNRNKDLISVTYGRAKGFRITLIHTQTANMNRARIRKCMYVEYFGTVWPMLFTG